MKRVYKNKTFCITRGQWISNRLRGTPLHNLTVRHRLPRYNQHGFDRLRDYNTSANARKDLCLYIPSHSTNTVYLHGLCMRPMSKLCDTISTTLLFFPPKSAPNSQSYASDDLPDLSKSMTLPGFDITDDPKEKGRASRIWSSRSVLIGHPEPPDGSR